MLLLVVYVLYYLVVILLDKAPARKTASTQAVDFVISEVVAAPPVKIKTSLQNHMALIDDDEIDEIAEEEQASLAKEKDSETDESLQSALRMETFSDETEFELDAEELIFQLA